MSDDPMVTLTYEVPLSTARASSKLSAARAYVAACVEAVAKWEAEHARFTVHRRADSRSWYIAERVDEENVAVLDGEYLSCGAAGRVAAALNARVG